ncbi:hypothetical protein FFI16_002630 [Pseudomonas sp. KBS0710]|nr:hypothetical protein FFI16_002630 [Pseudomonas sp. KBS0710]
MAGGGEAPLKNAAPGLPPSRASPLPHLTAFQRWNSVKCGSGLAREEASQNSIKPQARTREYLPHPEPRLPKPVPAQPALPRPAETPVC